MAIETAGEKKIMNRDTIMRSMVRACPRTQVLNKVNEVGIEVIDQG